MRGVALLMTVLVVLVSVSALPNGSIPIGSLGPNVRIVASNSTSVHGPFRSPVGLGDPVISLLEIDGRGGVPRYVTYRQAPVRLSNETIESSVAPDGFVWNATYTFVSNATYPSIDIRVPVPSTRNVSGPAFVAMNGSLATVRVSVPGTTVLTGFSTTYPSSTTRSITSRGARIEANTSFTPAHLEGGVSLVFVHGPATVSIDHDAIVWMDLGGARVLTEPVNDTIEVPEGNGSIRFDIYPALSGAFSPRSLPNLPVDPSQLIGEPRIDTRIGPIDVPAGADTVYLINRATQQTYAIPSSQHPSIQDQGPYDEDPRIGLVKTIIAFSRGAGNEARQGPAEVGRPVTWSAPAGSHVVMQANAQNLTIDGRPAEGSVVINGREINASSFEKLQELKRIEGRFIQMQQQRRYLVDPAANHEFVRLKSTITNLSREIPPIPTSGIDVPDRNVVFVPHNGSSGNATLTYTTPAPELIERGTNSTVKRVEVSSSTHYRNVTVPVTIPERERDLINVFWLTNGTRVHIPIDRYIDSNGNGLIDEIVFTAPHLSNQTFDITLTVLDVQSYPTVGGTWSVGFTTRGTANLTIQPVNTTWSNTLDGSKELEFLSLTCGGKSVPVTWKNGGVFVANYSCNSTSIETSKELRPGEHHLNISFGPQSAIASNLAGITPTAAIVTGASGLPNSATDVALNWSTNGRLDAPFTHSATGNPDRIMVGAAGVYRVDYGVYVTTTGSGRYQALTHLLVNGVSSDACYGSGYNRGTQSTQDLVSRGTCLVVLNASDNLSIALRRASSDTTQGPAINGSRSWFDVEKVNDANVAVLRDTAGGASYNHVPVNMTWNDAVRSDSYYNFTPGSDGIRVTKAGLYLVSYGVGVTSTSTTDRASAYGAIQVKPQGGSYSNASYGWSHANQRGLNNAQDAAVTASVVLNLSVNDTVRVVVGRASVLNTTADLLTVGNRSQLDLEYLGTGTLADTLRMHDTAGGVDLDPGPVNLSFDTTDSIGSDFSVNTANDTVTVQRTGLYRVSYGVYTSRTTGTNRFEHQGAVLVNDAKANACYGEGYNRGIQAPYNSMTSGAGSSCLLELTSGDTVSILSTETSTTAGQAVTTVGDRVWLTMQSLDDTGKPPQVTNARIAVPTGTVSVYTVARINASIVDLETAVANAVVEVHYPNGTLGNISLAANGNNWYNATFNLSKLGTYRFEFIANDTTGNVNASVYAAAADGNTTITTTDTTPPTVGVKAMNATGTVPINTQVCLNVSGVSDNYQVSSVKAEIINSNGLHTNLTMTDTGSACAGVADDGVYGVSTSVGSAFGTFNYTKAFVTDAGGNTVVNATNQNLTVQGGTDTVPPVITIGSPANSTYYTGAIDINATVNERVGRVFWSLDLAPNGTTTNDTEFHYTNLSAEHAAIADGHHTIYFYANDTSNNNGTANVSFIVDTTPPVIGGASVNSTNETYPASFRLIATVTDSLSPVSSVRFEIEKPNGTLFNVTPTPAGGGLYTYDYAPPARGTYRFTHIYATSAPGTSSSAPSIAFDLKDTTTLTSVTITNSSPDRGTTIALSATLLNSSGLPVAGQAVETRVGGTLIATNTTDGAGGYIAYWTIPNGTTPGVYALNVSYPGNASDGYLGTSDATTTITIYATTKVSLTLNTSTAVVGQPVGLTARYTYDNGTPIAGRPVDLGLTDQRTFARVALGSYTTNATGYATTTWTTSGASADTYTANATAAANATLGLHGSSNTTPTIRVYPVAGTLTITLNAPSVAPTTNLSLIDTFLVNATVTCNGIAGQSCGSLNATARYANTTPWYDTNWAYRRSYAIHETSGTDQYDVPVNLTIDTSSLVSAGKLRSDCADLRFVLANGTVLDDWYDNASSSRLSCGGTATLVWVKVPKLNASATTTVYAYYGDPNATDARNLTAVFTTSTQTVRAYPVDPQLSGGAIAIVSFPNGNSIGNGTANLTLGIGGTGTLTAGATTGLRSTGPFYAERSSGVPGVPASPVSLAGTEFVNYLQRDTGDLNIVSPWGSANVTIYNSTGSGWNPVVTTTVTPSAAYQYSGMPTGGTWRVSSDAPVLVVQTASASNADHHPLAPVSDDAWGVPSATGYGACLDNGTTGTIYYSDGTSAAISCNAGGTFALTGNLNGYAPAAHVVANKPIFVHQQADGDGTESSSFLPERDLSTTYAMGRVYEYVTISATQNDTVCHRYDTTGAYVDTQVATGGPYPYPSFARFTTGNAGDRIVCDHPVQAYSESGAASGTAYETVLFGPRLMRQRPTSEPTVTPGTETAISADITTNVNATPLWTYDGQPQTCTLGPGSSCTLTWNVSANETGVYETYAYARSTLTAAQSVHATINVTPPKLSVGALGVNTTGPTPVSSSVCLNVSGVPTFYTVDTVTAQVLTTDGLEQNHTMRDTGVACAGTAGDGVYGVTVSVGSATGNFTYQAAYVNDTYGNTAVNASPINVSVQGGTDTIPPSLTIGSPLNQTYTTGDIDYNVTGSEPLGAVLVSIDGAPNITTTNDTSAHFYTLRGQHATLADGHHTVVFWANDTSGNVNTSNVSFIVDTTPPVISSETISTTNMTYGQSALLSAHVTDSLSTVTSVLFEIAYPNGSTINRTPTEGPAGVYNLTLLPVQRGTYAWTHTYATSIPGTNTSAPGLTVDEYERTNVTNVTTTNANPTRAQTISLSATLTNRTGPVSGQSLAFRYGPTLIGTNTTDASGLATYHWTIPNGTTPGVYALNVTYAQNDTAHYRASGNTSASLDLRAGIRIGPVTLNATSLVIGQTIGVTARMTYDNGTPIAGANLTGAVYDNRTLQSTSLGSAVTNATGYASFSWNSAGSGEHLHVFNFTYAGNASLGTATAALENLSIYANESKGALNVTLVSPAPGSVINAVVGQNVTVTATVECIGAPGQTCYTVQGSVRGFQPATVSWWNETWAFRRNVTITERSGSAQTEYQVPITLDTATLISHEKMQPDCGDIRIIGPNNASYPYAVQHGDSPSACNESSTVIWVRVPQLNASQTLQAELYYGAPHVPDGSDAATVFSETSPRTVAMAVDATLAGSPIELVSLASGNTITDGTTTNNLGLQQTASFSTGAATRINATGPFYGDTTSASMGMPLVPTSMAGRNFTVSLDRGTGNLSIASPYGPASVTVSKGAAGGGWTPMTTLSVTPGSTKTYGGMATGAWRIESNVSILVAMDAGTEDYYPVAPAGTDLWGVPSAGGAGACLENGTTGTIYYSSGTTTAISCSAGGTFTLTGASNGTAPAAHVVTNKPVGVHQEADGDGTEASTFMRGEDLSETFALPGDYEYVAISAPTSQTRCDRFSANGTRTGTVVTNAQTAPFPSFARFDAGSAGDRIVCSDPVHAYYERAYRYETLLYGREGFRQSALLEPNATVSAEEDRASSVPTTSGSSFSTTNNPQTCTLNASENCTMSWNVTILGAGLRSIDVNASFNPTADSGQTQINVTSADLTIPTIDVGTPPYRQGQNVTFRVNVSNTGGTSASGFNVSLNISLWDGTWLAPNSTIKGPYTLAANASMLVNYTWAASLGVHNITAYVDPENAVAESNESNNEYSTNVSTSAWNVVFGSFNSYNISLLGQDAFRTWEPSNYSGVIFYADADSTYLPADLKPLNGTGDLATADAALGMTYYNDSISARYDTNHDGIADTVGTFDIGGRTVTNVPIIDSTNTSAFVTGILWDSGDGGSSYNGSQDLVFVTRINQSHAGAYGTYDYEVALPSPLKRLKPGTNLITRTVELR